jgi:hypothetical protein
VGPGEVTPIISVGVQTAHLGRVQGFVHMRLDIDALIIPVDAQVLRRDCFSVDILPYSWPTFLSRGN